MERGIERREAARGREDEGGRCARGGREEQAVAVLGGTGKAREDFEREEQEHEPEKRQDGVAASFGRRHAERVHGQRVDPPAEEEVERLAAHDGRGGGESGEGEKRGGESQEAGREERPLTARERSAASALPSTASASAARTGAPERSPERRARPGASGTRNASVQDRDSRADETEHESGGRKAERDPARDAAPSSPGTC